MDFIYVLLIMSIVFFSLHLTSNHKKYKPYLYLVSTLLGLFMIAVFIVLTIDILRGLIHNDSCKLLFIQSYCRTPVSFKESQEGYRPSTSCVGCSSAL